MGVRSIENTRYHARLDAKVEELTRVYCSEEFVQDIYHTLSLDGKFVEMLQSVWRIDLSEATIQIYQALVMYRQSLIRTETGYHVPSSEEVIAGIKSYFDPAQLSDTTARLSSRDSYLIRIDIIKIFHGDVPTGDSSDFGDENNNNNNNNNIQALLLRGIICCMTLVVFKVGHFGTITRQRNHTFSVPAHLAKAISKSSTTQGLKRLKSEASVTVESAPYYLAWVAVHTCLENLDAGPACECPFVYFFIKYCLDRDMGVPKLALALYDRMNMQLFSEFIMNDTMRQPQLRAQPTGPVDWQSKVQKVQPLPGCDLLQP